MSCERLQIQLTHPFYGFFGCYQDKEGELYVLRKERCVMFVLFKKTMQLLFTLSFFLFFCLLFRQARKVSSYFAITFEKWLYT